MTSARPPAPGFGFGSDAGTGSGCPAPRSSLLMARLTLSAIERASGDPGLWREPELHRALLVSGLSLMVGGMALLQADFT